MLISEAFNLYRNEYQILKIQAVRIRETHEQVKRTLIQNIGDKDITELTMQDISNWFEKVKDGRCQNTSRIYLSRIRVVLKYLELKGIPCLKSDLIPVPKRVDTAPNFITSQDVSKMINATPRIRNKFIIALLYSSGIRLSELISLNKGDIRDKRFTVIGKGGKARLCFIDDKADELLQKYLRSREDTSEALVISYTNKDRMTATNIQLLVKNAAKRARIPQKVTPHTLRHSFATNFLQNNGNLRYCQELMGHSKLETTAHYAHVTNVELERQYNKYHSF